ncbi:MAG: hypothetical protein WBZ31_06025, partial [Thiobacillus sp.]
VTVAGKLGSTFRDETGDTAKRCHCHTTLVATGKLRMQCQIDTGASRAVDWFAGCVSQVMGGVLQLPHGSRLRATKSVLLRQRSLTLKRP